jgi:hypothetical protein
MKAVFKSSICVAALLTGLAVSRVEISAAKDVAFGSVARIGDLRVTLWNAALAQSGQNFALDNVTGALGGATFIASRIEVTGLTSSRSDLEAPVPGNSAEGWADKIAKLSADRIVIPELTVNMTIGDVTQKAVYRNVVIANVAQGRAAQVTIGTAAQDVSAPQNKSVVTQGRTTISDLDVPAFARVYLTKAGQGAAPAVRLYGAFSIDDTVTTGQDGSVSRIGRMTGQDLRARPTQESWAVTIAKLSTLSNKGKLSDEEQSALLSGVADLLSAIEVGGAEAADIQTSGLHNGVKSDTTMKRIAYSSADGTRKAEFRIEELNAASAEGKVAVDLVSVTGFSFASTIDQLVALRGQSIKNLDKAAIRRLLPTIGTMHITGVDIDTVSKDGDKQEPVKATVQDIEFTADAPVNGIPTNLRFGITSLKSALPATSDDEGISNLIDLGYSNIEVSFGLAANWREQAKELDITQLSFQGTDMGSLSVEGTLADVTSDVFNPDTAVASVALLSSKARTLNIAVQNTGLFDRYLANAAKEQNTKPEALRRSYGTAAAVIIPSMIGASDQAQAITQAISRFIAKPGKLTLSATSKDPAGVGVAEFMAQPEPGQILEKLNVTAKAE